VNTEIADHEWDISFSFKRKEDVVMLEVGDEVLYLTANDLKEMVQELHKEIPYV